MGELRALYGADLKTRPAGGVPDAFPYVEQGPRRIEFVTVMGEDPVPPLSDGLTIKEILLIDSSLEASC